MDVLDLQVSNLRDLRGAPLSVYCLLGLAADKAFDVGAIVYLTGYGRSEVRRALAKLMTGGKAHPQGERFWRYGPDDRAGRVRYVG